MNKKKITPALLSGMMTISMGTTPISVLAQEEQPQEINETNVEQVNEPVSTEETEITVNTNSDSQNNLTELPKGSEKSNDNSNVKTDTSAKTNKEIVKENAASPMNLMSQNNVESEEKEASSVSLTINGQPSGEYSSLSAALNAIPDFTEQATIKMNSDLNVDGSVSQLYDYKCRNLVIDCGGYTLSSTYAPLSISGANVTIQNGTVSMNIYVQSGTLRLSNIEASYVSIIGGTVYVDSQSSIGNLFINTGQIYYAVDSVSLSEENISLPIEENKQLTATMTPASANGKVSVSWESSNDNVASVSNGTVTGVSEGNATITATVIDGFTGQARTDTCEVTVTKKDGSTLITEPSNLTATYGQKLSNISLPKDWTWVNGDTSLSVGTQTYTARFDTTSYEDEYDFSAVDGYIKDNHYIERNLTVDVSKANTTLTIPTDNMDKAYDGNPVAEPSVNKTGSTKEVTFTWYIEDGDNWIELSSAPKDTGSYKLVASVEADENYNEAKAEKEFSISQTTNEWTEELSIIGWTYGKQANEPTAKAKFGSVTYSYSDKENGTYTDTVPTDAGTWYVKATVDGNENYTGLEVIQEFTISKADSSIAFKDGFSLGKTYDTKAVVVTADAVETTGSKGNVSFIYEKKVGDTWEPLSEAPINAGTYQVTAYLEGDMNYNAAQSEPLEFTISKAETSLEIKSNLTQSYNGQPVSNPEVEKSGSSKEVTIAWYEKDGNDWKELTSAPTDAGTYKVEVHVDEDENYNSANAVKEFSISQTTNEWTEELSITDWTHGEQANEPTAKAKFGTVTFSYSDKEDGTYIEEVPIDAGTWYVKATVEGNENYTGLEAIKEFTISKANSSIAFKDGFKLDKTYDTKAVVVTADAVETAGSKGNISFTYEKKVNDAWETLSEAPTGAGTYHVTATLEENTNYKSATSQPLEFTIGKAQIKVGFNQSNIDKEYDGKEVFVGTYQQGGSHAATRTWYQKLDDGTWKELTNTPKNAGSYKVVLKAEGNENYIGAQTEMTFEITKAVPTYTLPSGLVIKQGETLSSVVLPEGFTWKDDTQKADTLGTQTFKATYTPEDTTNYQTVDVDVTVDVVPATTPVNQPPVINAKDQTLTVGDKFDPMKGVTATDKEDGDLTDKIVITKNTVDTSKAGKYTIDYEVTDNGGIRVRKTIVVTVKEKATTGSEENKPDTDKKTPSKDTTQTSTQTNVLAWTLLGLASAGAFITGLFKRKHQ